MAKELTPFLALHFRGPRFDESSGMPVETLGELVAYRDLVAEVARLLFLERHKERQRVPKGFADRLRLRIRHVAEGSAVPMLERPLAEGAFALPDEFDHAQDVILEAIAAVGEGLPISKGFPRGGLVHFNRLGQGLGDDESIELRKPDTATGPRYTQAIRKALLFHRSMYQREAVDRGWVTEVDADRMRFHLQRSDGSSVPAPIDLVTFDEVKEALAPTGEGPRVSVVGVGVFDRDDRLVRFDSVHELTPADDDVSEAVRAAEVTAGWLDGEGAQTDPDVSERARSLLAALVEGGAPLPSVFPIPDGGVQAEWSIGNREVSVAVEPGGSLYVISVNVISGESSDTTLSEDDPARVLRLVLPDAS